MHVHQPSYPVQAIMKSSSLKSKSWNSSFVEFTQAVNKFYQQSQKSYMWSSTKFPVQAIHAQFVAQVHFVQSFIIHFFPEQSCKVRHPSQSQAKVYCQISPSKRVNFVIQVKRAKFHRPSFSTQSCTFLQSSKKLCRSSPSFPKQSCKVHHSNQCHAHMCISRVPPCNHAK